MLSGTRSDLLRGPSGHTSAHEERNASDGWECSAYHRPEIGVADQW
jgi:hypothetical protein